MLVVAIMDKAACIDKIVLLILIVRISCIMIDRLRQMAIFAKTIDHGSFRGAAKALRLSPSVVSHHISQLEEHLGVALIYRSTRKLALTQEGERLLAATRAMLEAAEGELKTLSATAAQPSGELRITAPSALSKSPFMDTIAAFAGRYPRIRLALDFSDERKEIITDKFDVAIRMSLKSKASPSTRKLFQVRRRLVASPSFIERQQNASQPDDLKDWPWLELAPVRSLPIRFQKDGSIQAVQRTMSHLSCNDVQAVYRLARAGAGLAVVPEFLAESDAASGVITYVLADWELDPLHVFAAWPSNAPKDGLIKLFVNALSQDQLAK